MQTISRTIWLVYYTLALFLPASVLAQTSGGADLARGFVKKINDAILFPLIALMLGIAMLVFLYGCFLYVYNSDSDEGREKGRKHILWGVVGLLVMVSAYAILEIADNTFGLSSELQNAQNNTR